MSSWPLLVSLAASVTPVDAATGSITGYIVGFGPLGIIALAMAWLMFRGWRLIPPSGEEGIRQHARDEARADLTAENQRLLTRAEKAEEARDEALKFAQVNIIPLLLNFTNATSALLPILQEVVRNQEGGPSDLRRRR